MARNERFVGANVTTIQTYDMYKAQLITLAENVLIYENMPTSVNIPFLNREILRKGSIAFFVDDVMKELVALPYRIIGPLDIYGFPNKIQCFAKNGYQSKVLNKGEFVIMYDNNSLISIYPQLINYAKRLTHTVRTTDINVAQQKTPRIIQGPQEQVLTLKNLIKNLDNFEDYITAQENLAVDGLQAVVTPAPYVAGDLDTHFNNIWAEAMRLIGVASASVTKKERVIKDEIYSSQGGTIASRWFRYEPRKKAFEEIKRLFSIDIDVKFYDNDPSTLFGDWMNRDFANSDLMEEVTMAEYSQGGS